MLFPFFYIFKDVMSLVFSLFSSVMVRTVYFHLHIRGNAAVGYWFVTQNTWFCELHQKHHLHEAQK